MTQSITIKPNEKGTAIVTITPTDEDGTELVFSDLTNPKWQLMKSNGVVINGRTFESCTMSSLTFVLSGDDLAVFGIDDFKRVLSFQATYNSSLGNNLPLVAECEFKITKLLGQINSN